MIDFALGFLIGAGAGWAAAKWRGRRGADTLMGQFRARVPDHQG